MNENTKLLAASLGVLIAFVGMITTAFLTKEAVVVEPNQQTVFGAKGANDNVTRVDDGNVSCYVLGDYRAISCVKNQ